MSDKYGGDRVQWLSGLVALAEDLGSVPTWWLTTKAGISAPGKLEPMQCPCYADIHAPLHMK